MAKFDPIKNAVILDIETAGVNAGSPIHEISMFQMDTRRGYQFLMEPNFVVKQQLSTKTTTDNKRLTTSGKDKLVDFFDYRFLVDPTDLDSTTTTSLREIANSVSGQGPNGKYALDWADTLIARAYYLDALERQKMDPNDAIEFAARKIAGKIQEGELIDDNKVRNLIKSTDKFLYETVIQPLEEDPKSARQIYPYLSKIFKTAGSPEEAVDIIRKSSLSNISILSRAHGVSMKALITNQPIPVENIVGEAFYSTRGFAKNPESTVRFGNLMAGRAIWIANANFESKQFGAQVASLESDLYSRFLTQKSTRKFGRSQYFKALAEGIQKEELSFLRGFVGGGTSPYTADVFTISNPQIAKKRAHAMLRGFGWTDVFKAYSKHMKAGDVGDIIDITKAHQEYMIKTMSYFGDNRSVAKKPLTLSMDISYRLYKAAEVMSQIGDLETLRSTPDGMDKILKALFEAETHVGIEDAAKTESYVLSKSYAMSSMYEEMLDDPLRFDFSQVDKKGSLLAQAKHYSFLYNRIIPEVQGVQLRKRVASSLLDFLNTFEIGKDGKVKTVGQSEQTTGHRRLALVDRVSQRMAESGEITFHTEKGMTSFPARASSEKPGKTLMNYKGTTKDLKSLMEFLAGAEGRGYGADYSPIVSLMRSQKGQERLGRQEAIDLFFDSILKELRNEKIVTKDKSSGLLKINRTKLTSYVDHLRHSTNERIDRVIFNSQSNRQNIEASLKVEANATTTVKDKIITPQQPAPKQPIVEAVLEAEPEVKLPPPKKNFAEMNEIEKALSQRTRMEFSRILENVKRQGKAYKERQGLILAKDEVLAMNSRIAKGVGKGLVAAAGIGAIGAIGNILFSNKDKESPRNLRTVNYQTWLNTQREFYGNQNPNTSEGMSHNGILSMMRKLGTDFGSPYQGPEYSSLVFEQQGLLKARESYLRKGFAERHFTEMGDIGSLLQKIRLNTFGSYLNNMQTSRSNYNMGGGEKGTYNLAGLKKNQNLTKINLSNYKITVQDADTIVLNRKGAPNELNGFFGMNEKPITIRLGGIDAPETAHGDRSAQPFAYEAKAYLKGMIESSRNLEIYVDPKNVTYGRQVGFIFGDDGENLNLELIRKGYASYLPYRGRGVQQAYDEKIFGKASKLAQGNDYAMWGTPYFQAYRDAVQKSGQSITFNTLANIDKVAENSNLMSVYSLANSAQSMGFYSNQMQTEAAAIGQRVSELKFSKEKFDPVMGRGSGPAPHKSYMLEMLTDLGNLIKNKGGKINNKVSVKSVMKLNKSMSIDSTGVTTNIYNKRRMQNGRLYRHNKMKQTVRRNSMATSQKAALRNSMMSPIGHHRY